MSIVLFKHSLNAVFVKDLRSTVLYINEIKRSLFIRSIIFSKFSFSYQFLQLFNFKLSIMSSTVVLTEFDAVARDLALIRNIRRSRDRFRKNSVVDLNLDLMISILSSSSSAINSRTIRRAHADFARRKKDSNCLRCAKNADAC